MFGFTTARPIPIKPEPGQDSVWSYPRPPSCEPCKKRVHFHPLPLPDLPSMVQVKVIFNGETIIDSENAWIVRETSHPPSYYFPQSDVKMECLRKNDKQTFCEWKGKGSYYDIIVKEKTLPAVCCFYSSLFLRPSTPGFIQIQLIILKG